MSWGEISSIGQLLADGSFYSVYRQMGVDPEVQYVALQWRDGGLAWATGKTDRAAAVALEAKVALQPERETP